MFAAILVLAVAGAGGGSLPGCQSGRKGRARRTGRSSDPTDDAGDRSAPSTPSADTIPAEAARPVDAEPEVDAPPDAQRRAMELYGSRISRVARDVRSAAGDEDLADACLRTSPARDWTSGWRALTPAVPSR
jgi:hypothetical protein